MQKNLYFQALVGRENALKNAIYSFFLYFSSYPRLLLEVFLRKNFGERYFRLSSALTVAAILAILPFALKWVAGFFLSGLAGLDALVARRGESVNSIPMSEYFTWYLFIIVFLLFSIQRNMEVKRNPSVFDFARYSLGRGQVNPTFLGTQNNYRFAETVFEPAVFFVLGLILWLFHQKIGMVLTACSIFYSLSYVASYNAGDNFIMDKIDEIICNEELKKAFVDGLDEEETRGFRFMGRKPEDEEMRKQILPLMMEEDDVVVAR